MLQCEICNKQFESLDTHHIHSKCFGGSDKKCNLCRICPNCHRQVHIGKIIIEGRFSSTAGSLLVWRLYDEESITNFPLPKCFIISEKYLQVATKNN